MSKSIKPDWRLVKVDQIQHCDQAWIQEKGITACGVYYLIDVNLHVHICSFTPTLEAWPVQFFVDFSDSSAAERDEGQAESELGKEEEPCSYFDLDVLKNPSISATSYIPEIEEGEEYNAYRVRVSDEVREKLAANPVSF